MVDGGIWLRSHEGRCFCVHGTPRRAGDGPTGERQSAFHCLAVVRPRAQGSPIESWQCFGYVAFAQALPRGGNTRADACYARAQGAGPASLMYGNARASRAKVDKRYAAGPRFV